MICRLFAERGYHVLIQSCRGQSGSGGEFYPVRNDASDGRSTIEWLAAQKWFDGRLGTMGASYLGFTQWAISADPPVPIRASAIQVSSSKLSDTGCRGGFPLLDNLAVLYVLANLRGSRFDLYRAALTARRRLAPLWNHLPLVDLDRLVTGGTVDYYQDWISHAASDDPFWDSMNFRRGLSASTAEVHLMGGWYDPYLPDIVADYGELRRLGRRPRLVIGPWNHYQMVLNGAVYRETVALMERTLADGGAPDNRPAVRVQLTGTNKWLDFADWPPLSDAVTWRLQSNRGLSASMPGASEPDRYRFDPADPTPSVGGPVLLPGAAGPKDNRALEARRDVLVYTSDPLPQDLDVVGPVEAELYIRSSLSHTDFFVRLCDVDDHGRSFNVSDGIARLGPEPASSDVRQIRVEMLPAAHRFGRGHRLRVQVSSGAHPRFARNLGSGEPLATGRTLRVAEQEVFHDPERPSAVTLPVLKP